MRDRKQEVGSLSAGSGRGAHAASPALRSTGHGTLQVDGNEACSEGELGHKATGSDILIEALMNCPFNV